MKKVFLKKPQAPAKQVTKNHEKRRIIKEQSPEKSIDSNKQKTIKKPNIKKKKQEEKVEQSLRKSSKSLILTFKSSQKLKKIENIL
jgi:hypothetical protein